MSKYFTLLNINKNDIIDEEKILNLTIKYGILICDPKYVLTETAYVKLSELGNLFCLLFEKRPYEHRNSIHVDLEQISPCLNIIIKGQGKMNWYNPTEKGVMLINPANQKFLGWFKNFGNALAEWNNGKIALVDVSIPHQVWNIDTETRLCISVRWSANMNMEETVSWFNKNFNLE